MTVILPFVVAIVILSGNIPVRGAEEKHRVQTEKLSDKVTRLVYADGSEEWEVAGRGKVQFVPSPPPAREEPRPGQSDVRRGYIVFSPEGRGGVLPEYRPANSEITESTAIFAAPGELEPATFALRPLKDLGVVTFTCGDLVGKSGAKVSGGAVDVYIVEATVEQIGLNGPAANQARWVAKWLRPGNTARATIGRNIQVYLDVHVPANAKPGSYTGRVAIKPQQGRASTFTARLEVLPLKLARPISWGIYRYDWLEPDKRADFHRFALKEMRRAGMTQCVISPIHYQNRMPIDRDGLVDFSIYDQCVALYREAGFEDPPILAMEGLMFAIAGAMGKTEALRFSDYLTPGVKAEEIPSDVREFTGKVVRRIYDHGLEVKWPNFYVYFADEPVPGTPNMEKARFMFGAARLVAPEMQTAATLYTLEWWQALDRLVDLNIAHYVHPCHNADANRRWREKAMEQHAKLCGIDFIGPLDSFWEGRQITFTAEKGQLKGMMCWIQTLCGEMQEPFSPFVFLPNTWKGGPWCLREKDGGVWRALPWIGVREGIDDSRYVQTLSRAIEDAQIAGRADIATRARMILEKTLDEVPWVPGVRDPKSEWTAARADAARRRLAEASEASYGDDWPLRHRGKGTGT